MGCLYIYAKKFGVVQGQRSVSTQAYESLSALEPFLVQLSSSPSAVSVDWGALLTGDRLALIGLSLVLTALYFVKVQSIYYKSMPCTPVNLEACLISSCRLMHALKEVTGFSPPFRAEVPFGVDVPQIDVSPCNLIEVHNYQCQAVLGLIT